MTTRQQIEEWAKRGIEDGKRYMVVKCDTFDWSDYPVYYNDKRLVKSEYTNPGSMQKVMESYDLEQDLGKQLNTQKAHVE